MKRILLLCYFVSICMITYTQESMNYCIRKTDYQKGNYKIIAYEIHHDSIIVTRFSTGINPTKILYSNKLSTQTKEKLLHILSNIRMETLNTEYVGNSKGQLHALLEIEINNYYKSIFWYFGQEPDLEKIIELINELLPAETEAWYDVY